MKILLLLILSFSVTLQSFAQRAQGSWQDYLSFTNATDVAVGNNMIFCGTEGGLFYLDQQDNSINKFSGLSDFSIQTLAFSTENNVLVVAYSNSNLDLVYGSDVINLSDILRKTISADKTIYNITFKENEAYLSCGFGIVVINLTKQEIKDTYYIGENGSTLTVNDVDFYGEYIYAATNKGLLKALAEGTNLLDYNNWSQDESVPNAGQNFTDLAVNAGLLIANYSPGTSGSDESFAFDGTTWTSFYAQTQNVNDMEAAENYLLITGQNDVSIFDNQNILVGKINTYQLGEDEVSPISPRRARVSPDGSICIADYENALVKISGQNFESLFPAGPMDNEVFFLHSNNSDVWVTPGGRDDSWTNIWLAPRFQRLHSGEWTNFSKTEIPELTGFTDIVNLVVDPSDNNHFFVGSWGGGVLEFRNDEFVERYTNKNSPLETALPQQPDEPYVRIGGMDYDSEGNLWITNTAGTNNIHKLNAAGEWESFSMPNATGKNIGQLVVNGYNDKWVLIPRGNNAYVVDKTGDRIKQLIVRTYFSNGSDEYITLKNDVYSIVEDLDGAIWIGTSKGVAVYNNPSRIWDVDPFYGTSPGLDLNDGIYHPLLETQTVTAIAVDGANRKWMGTKGAGVFLISSTGEKEIEHFTTENSPLLSDNIMAITVNQKTGEVFFGTDKGLISYQGEATGGNKNYNDVYVYPNPVRETYNGPVTITGLIENTDIKITDISGNLVFKTTSLGGQAVWDGKNLRGKRVKTGVYLVFCNDENGEETHITKLLFIH